MMEISTQLFAMGMSWANEALRRQTTDARATELLNLAREMVAQRIESGFDEMDTLKAVQEHLVPYLNKEVPARDEAAKSRRALQHELTRAEMPVELPCVTLLRGEVTIIAGPASILQSIFREVANSLHKGIQGVARVAIATTDLSGFKNLPVMPPKAWCGTGVSRKKVDGWLEGKEMDLFLMSDMTQLLTANESDTHLEDWLRHCKRLATEGHTAILLGLPCVELVGVESRADELIERYRNHHTCYTVAIQQVTPQGVRVCIQPGNKIFQVQPVRLS
jgi:hypothetical protein